MFQTDATSMTMSHSNKQTKKVHSYLMQ